MEIKILYEDNHLLVVEKPNNLPVQLDDSKDKDLLTILKEDIKKRYQKPGNVYLALVHRLDRPVGGVIVFAKTSKAASRLSDSLRKNEIEREYLAITRGDIKKNQDTLINYLVKDHRINQVSVVQSSTPKAKKAILHYQVLDRNKGLTLLRVKLTTGRSHQIRVQLQEIGHPLYGDQKYGSSINKVGEQIALWSCELSFIHPVKKERITIYSYPENVYPWSIMDIKKL